MESDIAAFVVVGLIFGAVAYFIYNRRKQRVKRDGDIAPRNPTPPTSER